MSSFNAKVEIFSRSRGGRPIMPAGSGYAPDAIVPGSSARLPVILHDVPPGATLDTEFEAMIELRYPDKLDYNELFSGRDFDLVEGNRKIGRARIVVTRDRDPRDRNEQS